jgi:hypothetical protein
MVQTHSKTGDVYVFHREGSRWVKASLHESGELHWRTTALGEALLPPGMSPYMGTQRFP